MKPFVELFNGKREKKKSQEISVSF